MISLALASVREESTYLGPANLALCIALHESDEAKMKNFSMLFLEKQPQFAWYVAC